MFLYNEMASGRPALFDATTMATRFPKAWKHLCRYETELRAREHSAFDDDQWYRFGRNQNIDKQRLPKLGVAPTVPEMRVFFDSTGEFCLNNVRVNGVLVDDAYAWFVLGILNSRVCDFVFRRISKPKEPRPSGAYFEANKQYIAPLPIPTVTDPQRDQVTELSKKLQSLYSMRRDTIESIDQRISSSQMTPDRKEPQWIWADVHDVAHWRTDNPKQLAGPELTRWAKRHHESLLAEKIAAMDDQMTFGQTMLATFEDGQLKFYVGNSCLFDGISVSEDDACVILPQWQSKLRDSFVSESMDARRVLTALLDLRKTTNVELIRQLDIMTKQLRSLETDILSIERMLDDFIYGLYALTPDERKIIESDTAIRANARIPRVTL